MKNLTHKKSLILLSVGIFIIASLQILTRYTEISDMMQGLGIGLGIGLLVTSIIGRKLKHIKAS
ncbi:hypothetical protein C7448_10419 [Tenacibaculum gallaicum]|uniref:Uncharacterized protein n=1 Tax=Tenacibaculum gallaicum TaxID=561505 RepID=A0A3E0HVF3_9FLAO|nr:hypothetical protein [Tenacibaculum gallaicum]REH50408.1 hypothetical protein C7448_10419 [Tenacibaculum gallaicum]